MEVAHFVITPFCVRNYATLRQLRGGEWMSGRDPLQPEFVGARMRLLEVLSSAAVLGQSNLNFSWLVLVDPDLGQDYRARLRYLVGDKLRLIIREYHPCERLDSTQWLEPYIEGQPDCLVTTILDDDDAFGASYVDELQRAATEFILSKGSSLVRTFGCTNIWLWNMVPTRRAPLGTRSEWAGSDKVPACGFSLMCSYPAVPLTILGIRHKRAENYLDFSSEPADDGVARFRTRLAEFFSRGGIRLQEHTSRLAFQDLRDRTGHMIMSNHSWNVQAHRIFKDQVRPVKVTGPETFPEHTINWQAARKYLSELRPPYRARLKIRLRRFRNVLANIVK